MVSKKPAVQVRSRAPLKALELSHSNAFFICRFLRNLYKISSDSGRSPTNYQQVSNREAFRVAGDSSSISYIQRVEETKPIILTQKALSHIKSKHLEDYQTLFDLTEGLENSWLSMDSKRYDTSKLIVLGDNFKSPYTSVCRIDSTIDGIAVNRINTFYKKENFLDLSISTYNLEKNIYCNKKTEAIVRSEEGFQLPTEIVELL